RMILWALVLLPTVAAAAQWEAINQSVGRALVYLDKDSVKASGGIVQAWLRFDFAEPQHTKIGGKTFGSIKQLLYFDCDNARYERVKQILYSEGQGMGETVGSYTWKQQQRRYEPVLPHTDSAVIYEFVCHRTLKENNGRPARPADNGEKQ
ncbi:MAG: surface-adhesin E family protein, partial [Burkholderiales bacterium]